MKRSMMQAYVTRSDEAVALYQKAFDAKLLYESKNEDGSYLHAELDAYGQVLAISEALERKIGNTMQFCFRFGEGNEEIVKRAYEVLKDGAKIDYPLGPCMFGIVDKFGVDWCLFV